LPGLALNHDPPNLSLPNHNVWATSTWPYQRFSLRSAMISGRHCPVLHKSSYLILQYCDRAGSISYFPEKGIEVQRVWATYSRSYTWWMVNPQTNWGSLTPQSLLLTFWEHVKWDMKIWTGQSRVKAFIPLGSVFPELPRLANS
jgi:hypothetical protein